MTFFWIFLTYAALGHGKSNCSIKTAEELDQKLNAISSLIPDFEKVIAEYQQFKENCGESFQRTPFRSCLDNFDYFLSLKDQKGIYSPFLSDQEYLDRQPKDVVALPNEITKGIPKNYKELFKEKGWQWHFFSSHERRKGKKGLLKNRFVLRVPGEKVDKYFLFVTATDDPSESEAFQAIFVEKEYADRKGRGPRIHFRTFATVPGKEVDLHEHSDGGRCIECHQNGPRAIIPVEDQIHHSRAGSENLVHDNQFSSSGNTDKKVERERLALNDYINSYGAPNWDTIFPPDKHFKGVQLGEDVGCVDCHQGDARGRLIPGISSDLSRLPHGITDKVIRHPTMPPEMNLNDKQKLSIMESIQQEYHDKTTDWLVQKKCQATLDEYCDEFLLKTKLRLEKLFSGRPIGKKSLDFLVDLQKALPIQMDILDDAKLCQYRFNHIPEGPRKNKEIDKEREVEQSKEVKKE